MIPDVQHGAASNRAIIMRADLERQYQIALTENLLHKGIRHLADRIASRSALLVTTPSVAKFYCSALQRGLESAGLSVPMLVIPYTEQSKTLSGVVHICSETYHHGLGRNSVLIGMGGGVCTDMVTMAASMVRRGIGCIRIPTTLIGQVDAAVGIKGAVNISGKKSGVGCFYAPESVFIDPLFLQTLDIRHVSAGIAEIIKVAVVRDEDLFNLLEENIGQLLESRFTLPRELSKTVLWCSIEGMLAELRHNLYENRGYQRLMDFGHTFSPLLEARSGFRMSHGEAVAIDMAFTLALAHEMNWVTEAERNRVMSVILAAGLPANSQLLTEELCIASFCEGTAHRGGALNLVVPTGLGHAKFVKRSEQIPISTLRLALRWLGSFQPVNSRNFAGIAAAAPTPLALRSRIV